MEKNNETVRNGVQPQFLDRKKKRLIFYCLMMAVPCIQFAIFYIYVNFNSIKLAFEKYAINTEGLGYIVKFAGLDNFKEAFTIMVEQRSMVGYSALLYLCNFFVLFMALVFSFYIAKEFILSKFFRVILYIPHIVSSVVLVILYKYMVNDVFVEIVTRLGGAKWLASNGLEAGLLGGNASTGVQYGTVLFYSMWIGFGVNVMMFSGSMSGIDPSIIESSHLDGVNLVQEFWYIYIPLIFPTVTTFVVTGITGIFTNQMYMYTFFGHASTNYDVFGFYMYKQTLNGSVDDVGGRSYSVLSAMGVIITIILVPITLGVRKLLEKYGPRTD